VFIKTEFKIVGTLVCRRELVYLMWKDKEQFVICHFKLLKVHTLVSEDAFIDAFLFYLDSFEKETCADCLI
jgi:hypothetical protein